MLFVPAQAGGKRMKDRRIQAFEDGCPCKGCRISRQHVPECFNENDDLKCDTEGVFAGPHCVDCKVYAVCRPEISVAPYQQEASE